MSFRKYDSLTVVPDYQNAADDYIRWVNVRIAIYKIVEHLKI